MDAAPRRHRPQIALLSTRDAQDPRSWSGAPYSMARALERHLGEVRHLGPMPGWPGRLMRAAVDARRRLTGGHSLPGHGELLARVYARVARRRIEALDPAPDAIFSPAGSVLLARLRTRLPVIYSSDATARLMFDYYPRFTGLSRGSARAADSLERAAISRADLLLYPTRWAADSAIADYGADPARIRIVPYGANLHEEPGPDAWQPAREEDGACRLLLVGVNWEIKGGATAVEALRALRARGIPARLTVVGCAPPQPLAEPGLELVPFLDKNRAEDRARLDALYRAADFFVLPSRCECYGIVLCEAAAYGLPAVATRTGGIPEVVREGESGYTVPLAEGGAAFAERIAGAWADRPRYLALRAAARRAYETRLNWDAWGREAARAIGELLAARGA